MTDPIGASIADFRAGYELGYATGDDVGYARGVEDEGAAWTSVMTGCTETWRQPRRDELERRRTVDHQLCPRRCLDRPGTACARCIHAEAWQRRGGRPHLGLEREVELAREVRV